MVSKLTESSRGSVETGEVSMFATFKNLIPAPRQEDQLRRYIGRHRGPEIAAPSSTLRVVPEVIDEVAADQPSARIEQQAG